MHELVPGGWGHGCELVPQEEGAMNLSWSQEAGDHGCELVRGVIMGRFKKNKL